MKHLKSYPIFETKKELKLDKSIIAKLNKGLQQGYIEKYDVNFDEKRIKIYFKDNFLPDSTHKLIIAPIDNYLNRDKYHYTLSIDDHKGKFISTPSGNQRYSSFVIFSNLLLDAARKYVKANKQDGIKYNGKVYPIEKVLEFLQKTEIMKKIEADCELILEATGKELKKGTLCLYRNDKEYHDQKEEMTKDFDDPIEKELLFDRTPKYKITKTGKVYTNLSSQTKTIYHSAPLNSVEDYIKALEATYYFDYLRHFEKWKTKYDKDPSIFAKMPAKYLQKINPKLVSSTNYGIFDDE